jgi:hypothetical protein
MTASIACAVGHAPRKGLKHVHASGIPWTPEQEDELRFLAESGFSAREISRKLSVPRSRNAILGRARRMGVKVGMTMEEMAALRVRVKLGLTMEELAALAREMRETGKPREPIRPGPVTEAEAQLFSVTMPAPVALAQAPTPRPGRPSIPLRPVGRSVYELTQSCCRWIEGEPSDPRPFKCEGVAEVGTSWCPKHFKRAYAKNPPPMRLRVRELA